MGSYIDTLIDNIGNVYGHKVFYLLNRFMHFEEVPDGLVAVINHPDMEDSAIIVTDRGITVHTCGETFTFLELREAVELAIRTKWYERNAQEFVQKVSNQIFGES